MRCGYRTAARSAGQVGFNSMPSLAQLCGACQAHGGGQERYWVYRCVSAGLPRNLPESPSGVDRSGLWESVPARSTLTHRVSLCLGGGTVLPLAPRSGDCRLLSLLQLAAEQNLPLLKLATALPATPVICVDLRARSWSRVGIYTRNLGGLRSMSVLSSLGG